MNAQKQLEALRDEFATNRDPEFNVNEWFYRFGLVLDKMKAVEPVAWRAYWSSALNDAHFRQEDRLDTLKAYIEENAIFVDRITPVYEAPPNTYTAEQVAPLVEALEAMLEYPNTGLATSTAKHALTQFKEQSDD